MELVAQAATFARRPILKGEGTTPLTKAQIASKKVTLQRLLGDLLPMEQLEKARVQKELEALRLADLQVEIDAGEMEKIGPIMKAFPDIQVLDPTPFGWRDEQRLPKLVPFRTDNDGVVTFTSEVGDNKTIPPQVRRYYDDVRKTLAEKSISGIYATGNTERTRTEVFIKTAFAGLIPDSTRAKIRKALPLFDCVFILAEARDLKLDSRVIVLETPAMTPKAIPAPSRQGDPLVVGYKAERFWLIDVFDTTTLERQVAEEWASKP